MIIVEDPVFPRPFFNCQLINLFFPPTSFGSLPLHIMSRPYSIPHEVVALGVLGANLGAQVEEG